MQQENTMSEEQKDVTTTESSTVENQDVKQEEKVSQEADSSTAKQESTSEADVSSKIPSLTPDDVDDRGVPYKNRYYEMQRKFTELADKIPSMVQETVQKSLETGNAKKEPSKDELIRFRANNLDNPEYVAWADTEIEKLRTRELQDIIKQSREDERAVISQQQQKVDTHNKLVSDYPELFLFDKSGRVVNYNLDNPFTRAVAEELGSDPRYKGMPDAELIAANMVFARQARSKTKVADSKVKEAVSTVSKEKRKNLSEGGGNTTSDDTSKSEIDKAREELSRTGSPKAATRLIALQAELARKKSQE